MTSRLSIIRDCLTLTGNNLYSAVNDGSPEWLAGTASYDMAVKWVLAEHDWNFGKTIEAIDAPEDIDDPDPGNYTDAYLRPGGCLHVIKVYDEDGGAITDWRILGNYILVNHDGGIRVEFVDEPHPDDWDGVFERCVRHQTMAGIYRSLNKDTKAADTEERKAEGYLAKARPRSDLQEPGKTRFISTLSQARRTRRG